MTNNNLSSYEVILGDKYYLREIIEDITLEESLEEIAYQANVRLVKTSDLPEIVPGQKCVISGTSYGGTGSQVLLPNGVIWEVEFEERSLTHLTVTVFDKTIYLAKSEDEYLFPEGQTATQRIKKYAADWGIPLSGNMAETGVPLARAIYRNRSVYAMIRADLIETVGKGGGMFRLRMAEGGLELVKLGSNKTVWLLESGLNLESNIQKNTLEGTVTQVKVLGNETEGKLSPVLGIIKGETGKYGTLQKILSDSKARTSKEAETAGKKLLTGLQSTITVTCTDINTVRAGDKVKLNGSEYLTVSVGHNLGNPGRMNLSLAPEAQVRRQYYNE